MDCTPVMLPAKLQAYTQQSDFLIYTNICLGCNNRYRNLHSATELFSNLCK